MPILKKPPAAEPRQAVTIRMQQSTVVALHQYAGFQKWVYQNPESQTKQPRLEEPQAAEPDSVQPISTNPTKQTR